MILLVMEHRDYHRFVTRNIIENMEVLEININEKKDPFETVDRNESITSNLGDGHLHMRKKITFANESLPERKETQTPTKLQRRAKACTFYDPLINKSHPILCGAQNFVSIVRSRCRTRLGNQLSAYAAVRYFQTKYGMAPVLEPFQMKIISSVFSESELRVKSLNLGICCPGRKWKMIMALKEDKRTGIATGLSEKFEKNPEYYSRNFLIGLGHHTMPLFLFKGDTKNIKTFWNIMFSTYRYSSPAEKRVDIQEKNFLPCQQHATKNTTFREQRKSNICGNTC